MKRVPLCTRIVVIDGEDPVRKGLSIRIDQEPDWKSPGRAGQCGGDLACQNSLAPDPRNGNSSS